MMFLPIGVATGLTILLGVALTVFTPGPDKSLNRTLAWTALFCCWLLWLCAYMSQMYPLAQPERELDE
ncbi:hypothetical protein QOT17_006565 [Balamuthia mandrillaris]